MPRIKFISDGDHMGKISRQGQRLDVDKKYEQRGKYGRLNLFLDQERMVNEFTYKVLKYKDILIGLECDDPNFEWWWRPKKSLKYRTGLKKGETFTNVILVAGDLISLVVKKDEISILVNNSPLGILFRDANLLKFDQIFPFVYISSTEDSLEIV